MDAQGNVYVTGYALEAASGSYDYVTLKYNAAALPWRAVYDGANGKLDQASVIDSAAAFMSPAPPARTTAPPRWISAP